MLKWSILVAALLAALDAGTANAARITIGPALQTNAANFTMLWTRTELPSAARMLLT